MWILIVLLIIALITILILYLGYKSKDHLVNSMLNSLENIKKRCRKYKYIL